VQLLTHFEQPCLIFADFRHLASFRLVVSPPLAPSLSFLPITSLSNHSTTMTSTIDSAAQVGMGQGISSHPLHPATVHLPIGLLSLSFFLDSTQVIPQLSNGLNAFKLLPPAATLNAVSHYVGGAGLLFAVPTVLTGMSEL